MISLKRFSDEFKDETVKRIAVFFGFHSVLVNGKENLNYKMAEETLNEWLKPDHEMYIIEYKEKTAGFLHIAYKGSNVAWIEDIFVDENFRNKGIATRAIKIAEEIIKSNPGYTAICFDVVPRNEAALRLYYKLGYDNLSMITVRKELYENKRDKKESLLGFEFNY